MAKKNKAIDPAKIGISSYDSRAQVQKNSDAGLSWKPLGSISTAVRVGAHTPVMIFNNSGAISFVAFGDASLASPTNPSNGLPVSDYERVVFNSGENEYIRSNSALVFVYTSDPEINQ